MSDLNGSIGGNLEEIRELLNINQPTPKLGNDYAWFVGATETNEQGEYIDFSDTYINEGRWHNGWDNKFIDDVKSIKVGDKIALKSSYTRKKDLPFNNNGKVVGVMAIKAIGVVTENLGDGKNIKVNWERLDNIKEWYGKGVLRGTVHRVNAADGLMKKLLLQFTFENIAQDYSLCEEQYANDIEDSDEVEITTDTKDNSYTIDELGKILSYMYNHPKCESKVTSIYIFGIKYGRYIRENNYATSNIVSKAGINESYKVELNKALNIYDSIKESQYGVSFYDRIDKLDKVEDIKIKKGLPNRNSRENKIHALNSIIYGAPGTGKTYSTVQYAIAMIENTEVDLTEKTDYERKQMVKKYNQYVEDGKIVFTTFHQNYGYEDFIQGLRPDTKLGGLNFKNIDGVFKQIASRAIADNENNYVIIIDEINRANISKVFGELITLIEEDKRWGEINQTSVTLPSGDIFAVPNNLYILGTMNSSDKSISLIDAALRRRFIFIEQKPNSKLIKNITMKSIFEKLNYKLVKELDSTDLLIGHSYFINMDETMLADIFNKSIIPLLYEYFYDNRKKVISVLTDVLKDTNVAINNDELGRVSVKITNRGE